MKEKRGKLRRISAIALTMMLCIALLPLNAFAVEGDPSCQHKLVQVPEEAATCQHAGLREHSECTKCGAVFDIKTNEMLTDEEYQKLIIPPEAHKWDSGTVVKEATAAEPGTRRFTCTVCGSTYDEEIIYQAPPAVGKSFKLNGNQLSFKKNEVKTVPSFMKEARVGRIWIKVAKNNITLNWARAKNMQRVDGVIILRKTGKGKVYQEIGRVAFKTAASGTSRWSPKTSFVDKTANKKNTPYTYIVVSYMNNNGYEYLSNCSDWASGQTTGSKLASIYTAKINKKSVTLQVGGTAGLTLKYAKPKKTYNSKSFRWYSDNAKVAKVNSKGVVQATGVGTTKIRGRLSSGHEIVCTVKSAGAFKPSAPKLKVDSANDNSITLVWTKPKYANSYDLYQSNDGLHWNDPVRVKTTSKKVTGLKKGHRYTFYVIARNDNGKYSAESTNSNVIYQTAAIKRRPTALTGWPTSKTLKVGSKYTLTLKITSPDARKASLQMRVGKKWVTKKTIKLPKGAGKVSTKVTFPGDWAGKTSEWRLYIPRNNTSEEFTTKALTITSARKYQNPAKYVQISDSISKHGYNHYASKVLVNSKSTRAQHVEALIKTANQYKGNKYINGKSGAPGKGIDASGLVIQACYGAGVDLWPISPSTRPSNCVPKIMSSKLEKRKYTDDHVNINRGDLIFFYTGKNLVGHVAIYLGNDKILHASMVTGKVEDSTITELTKPASEGGKYCYTVAGARRIFH